MKLSSIISKFKPSKGLRGRNDSSTDPLNPFYENYFNLNRSKRNWQVTSFCFAILALITLLSYVKLSNSITIRPFVVLVNEKEGIIRNVGEFPGSVNYENKDRVIFSILHQHLRETRTVPLDSVLYGKNINNQYKFLSLEAQQKLLTYIEDENIRDLFARRRSRDIQISNISKITSNTYQLRWREDLYNENGGKMSETRYIGTFVVEEKEIRDEETLLINPLGIIIRDFSFTKEL